ncbi:hypothetical protein [Paraburkholderia bannensis]|uniref:hypothetical protein n=1 Tax=Paraburkholderia bannensis TaxID=765414 RepID=UPI002AB7C6F6|nr:hypothetical protein [Paraburkholderia bannensis]
MQLIGENNHHEDRVMIRKIRHSMRVRALLAATLTLAAVASSSYAASQDDEDHACRGDAFHFCASEIPNKEKITACMKQHYAELSPPCKAMFKKPPKGGAS